MLQYSHSVPEGENETEREGVEGGRGLVPAGGGGLPRRVRESENFLWDI